MKDNGNVGFIFSYVEILTMTPHTYWKADYLHFKNAANHLGK